MLMMMMSAIHNLSRSVGCALLAASGGRYLVLSYSVGEMLLYLAWKGLRRDFMYWVRVEGVLGIIISFIERVMVKVIVDFSGCLQFR